MPGQSKIKIKIKTVMMIIKKIPRPPYASINRPLGKLRKLSCEANLLKERRDGKLLGLLSIAYIKEMGHRESD